MGTVKGFVQKGTSGNYASPPGLNTNIEKYGLPICQIW